MAAGPISIDQISNLNFLVDVYAGAVDGGSGRCRDGPVLGGFAVAVGRVLLRKLEPFKKLLPSDIDRLRVLLISIVKLIQLRRMRIGEVRKLIHMQPI